MARDLGPDLSEVHATAADILRFWLEEVPPEKRFARDDALDAECAARFGRAVDEIIAHHAALWRANARSLLAAVIAIDQFSRNIHRGSARAFAGDALARALTGEAVLKGWDQAMTAAERQFLYMPYMHAESMQTQARALVLFAGLPGDPLDFARRHAAQVARFGRFPQRNEALGRQSTAEEEAFLREPGSHF
ncbi:DUF924 family protein [Sphingomonas sp. ID0503]|uniref:DUF924 family protein n=1 Tax=Sphingomonas sp. ID0503 TaxID=3399691 RepID=UPI003AFB385F